MSANQFKRGMVMGANLQAGPLAAKWNRTNYQAPMVYDGVRYKGYHYTTTPDGRRILSSSKYMPHQSEREKARRLRKGVL